MALKRINQGAKRKGPNFDQQGNLDRIEKSLKEAEAMTKAQKKRLLKAAPKEEEEGEDEEMGEAQDAEDQGNAIRRVPGKPRTKVKLTITDMPYKPVGGHINHHCPRKEHSSPKDCITGRCFALCPVCGHSVSNYGGTKCITCANNAKREAAKMAIEKKAAEDAARIEAARRKKEEESKKPRKQRWTAAKKAEAKAAGTRAMVVRAGILKKVGRTGAKAKKAKKEFPDLSDDDELTVKVAVLLYRYCEDLIWKF